MKEMIQFMVGTAMLVSPVVVEKGVDVDVYFPYLVCCIGSSL